MKFSIASALLLLHGAKSQDATVACPELTQSTSVADGTTFFYAVVGDVLCGRMEVDGERWVSIGVSPAGTMNGGDSVIGLPGDGTVQKYALSFGQTALMPEDQQTLMNTKIVQEGGKTIMEWAEYLVEEGENEILAEGENTFLFAYGNANALGYHAARGPFTLDLSAGSTAEEGEETAATCEFCPGGMPDTEFLLPTNDGTTCGVAQSYAATLSAGDDQCATVQLAQGLCCAPAATEETEAPALCEFCPDGVPDPDVMRPDGFTCGATVDFAATLPADDVWCPAVKEAQEVCCPPAAAEEAPPAATEAPPLAASTDTEATKAAKPAPTDTEATKAAKPPAFAKSTKASSSSSKGHKTPKDPMAKVGKEMHEPKADKASSSPSEKGTGKGKTDKAPQEEVDAKAEKADVSSKSSKAKSAKSKSSKSLKALKEEEMTKGSTSSKASKTTTTRYLRNAL